MCVFVHQWLLRIELRNELPLVLINDDSNFYTSSGIRRLLGKEQTINENRFEKYEKP